MADLDRPMHGNGYDGAIYVGRLFGLGFFGGEGSADSNKLPTKRKILALREQ